jgi:alkyl hydroperoxide reductase subunit AhpF
MATKLFECDSCGAFGKINVKGEEYNKTDIAYCPVCGSDISSPDDCEEDE